MDKVIILKGASDRGKTSTLNLLIDYLINNHMAICANLPVKWNNYQHTSDLKHDCFIILDVPDFGRVGIITNGDYQYEQFVSDCLNICLQYDCKSIIAAAHPKEMKTFKSIFTILLELGRNHKIKTIETTSYVCYRDGAPVDEKRLNSVCAENLANLLFSRI